MYLLSLRCVFLDKSAPQFSPNCPLYHDQLSVGLSVCKLYRGAWGTDCTFTLDLDPAQQPEHMQGVITSSDTKLDVNVLALNTTTVTFQPDNPPDQQLLIKLTAYSPSAGRRSEQTIQHSLILRFGSSDNK
ncbi:hypothetical protein J6590_049726 [Homalodisca vitripennis]|nr:hypothetical protein J6590_049726 [Homalodisca vitripennis]